MRKTVLVPLLELADPAAASFLELWVEPVVEPVGEPATDGLESLAFGPLKSAVTVARRALACLPAPARPAAATLMTPNVALAHSAGAALALALCPFLLRADFPYSRHIITGTLDFPAGGAVGIGDSGHIRHKLEAVRGLGQQREPLLLLLPGRAVGPDLAGLLGELAVLNIAVRPVSTLAEALDACTGRLLEAKGDYRGAA